MTACGGGGLCQNSPLSQLTPLGCALLRSDWRVCRREKHYKSLSNWIRRMSNAPTVADNGDRLRARFALRREGDSCAIMARAIKAVWRLTFWVAPEPQTSTNYSGLALCNRHFRCCSGLLFRPTSRHRGRSHSPIISLMTHQLMLLMVLLPRYVVWLLMNFQVFFVVIFTWELTTLDVTKRWARA